MFIVSGICPNIIGPGVDGMPTHQKERIMKYISKVLAAAK